MLQARRVAAVVLSLCSLGGALLVTVEAHALSHFWRIHELFSSSDGSVQYLVLHECCGSAQELYVRGLEVESKKTGNLFTFPRNLTGSSAGKYLLLATEAFAALPGAPTPDFTLPPGFFSLSDDLIWYSEARNYDSFTLRAGTLPLDGVQALRVTNYTTDAFQIVDNAPINYAGEKGHVVVVQAEFARSDCNDDGAANLADAVFLLDQLFVAPTPLACPDSCDANDDGELDLSDAVRVLLFLFSATAPPPEPVACGLDPTPDSRGCSSFSNCPKPAK